MLKNPLLFPSVTITGIADKGKAVGKVDGQVIFVEGAVPGDVADILVYNRKKGVMEGRIQQMITPSPDRVEPFCAHFGTCGGCKWQHLSYEAQLAHKQDTVENALRRLGKIEVGEYLPIIGAADPQFYRNKLEFSFSNKIWLTKEQIDSGENIQRNGLGFHLPGYFDKVVDVQKCYLQPDPSNGIRNTVRDFVTGREGYTYYDARTHIGFLRNILVRTASTGEVMVLMVFGFEDKTLREPLMQHLSEQFPNITSLLYVINPKVNDTIYDLDVTKYKGRGYIYEQLGEVRFKVGPKSFFQTNTAQALALYQTTADFAGLTGKENVYDLYTGLGSIACFVASRSKHVVGIEEVAPAIEDAKENATLNGFTNLSFYVGDVKELFNSDLLKKHGRPDVIITDPPRAGMHEKVVQALLDVAAPRIVYVSCNPATQARDLQLLSEKYNVLKSRAVDMFPHTHHIENVVLLELK